jgi:hypothetical protein
MEPPALELGDRVRLGARAFRKDQHGLAGAHLLGRGTERLLRALALAAIDDHVTARAQGCSQEGHAHQLALGEKTGNDRQCDEERDDVRVARVVRHHHVAAALVHVLGAEYLQLYAPEAR